MSTESTIFRVYYLVTIHVICTFAGLRRVKKQLLDTLANCSQPKCIALQSKYNIGELNTEINYSQVTAIYIQLLTYLILTEDLLLHCRRHDVNCEGRQ